MGFSKRLEASRKASIAKLAEMNKQEMIVKLTKYYQDLFDIYGEINVSPVSLAVAAFERKKKAGQLDEFNLPIRKTA